MTLRWIVLAAGCVAACGGSQPPDRTDALVGCLREHGGTVITRTAQLDALADRDPQLGIGFGLESISFWSIDVAADEGDVRQALVYVETPREPGNTPLPAPAAALRDARARLPKVRALVLMPASVAFDEPLNACAERVAREQIFP